MKSFTSMLSFLALLRSTNGDFPGIARSDMLEEAEHFLVDNTGKNAIGIVPAVTPCANYASGDQNQGEQTSAQWVRFAFHDFVTADIAAGTGGLDASLGFESDRDENKGKFVNDTLKFLAPTVSAYLSAADQIALGVLVSVTQCGGNARAIPLRVGRVDALTAGPSGVPGPHTPLDPTLAAFAKAGMSASDTISLVACGHSLGRVHATNFPEIVGTDVITSTNLDGGVPFDSNPDLLSNGGMNEYLTGTGTSGGPLVTSSNISARSDFRLFNSDGNTTITNLAANTGRICSGLFTRMIDTVPSTVTLSDPVAPMPWKIVDFIMYCSPGGSIRIGGLIRALYTDTAPPNKITYNTQTKDGVITAHTSDAVSGTGAGLFGKTSYYNFVVGITSPGTVSMNFQGYSYPIDDEIFILPTQSTVKSSAKTIEIKAAVLSSSVPSGVTPTGTLYVPEALAGTQSKKITLVTVPMKFLSTNGNYTLFNGKVSVSNVVGVIAKVAIGDRGSKTVKTTLFKTA